MRNVFLACGALIIVLSSCVPNRKLVYLQKEDLKHRERIPKDTVLRSHELSIREYRIQPLDVVSISFESLGEERDEFDFLNKLSPQTRSSSSSNSNMNNGILVDPEGYIDFAVLGKIKLVGLSLFEARDTLAAAARKFVPDVVVRVRMLNFRYTVLGEVNGEKTVISNNTQINMMEAIGLAGGLSELADRSHVKIIRQTGTTTEVFYIDLLEEDFMESPRYYVQQNDIIIVPPLKQRAFRKYLVPNIAIITSVITFGLLIVSLSNN